MQDVSCSYDPQYSVCSCFLNGAILWISKPGIIVTFDLSKEVFSEMSLDGIHGGTDLMIYRLGVFEECLYVVSFSYGANGRLVEVWLMKEYGVKAFWSKFITIPCDVGIDFTPLSYLYVESLVDPNSSDGNEKAHGLKALLYNNFMNALMLWILSLHNLRSSSFLGNNIIKLTSAKCIEREREALINFKHGLKDPSGRLSSWGGDDCCQWRGVRCNNILGHVVKLDLRNPIPVSSVVDYSLMEFDEKMAYVSHYRRSCLGGKIHSSLLQLKYLNYMDLSFNYFGGIRIPKFLGMFENLRFLNLSSSLFYGEIPPHLGNLSSLDYLHLGTTYPERCYLVDVDDPTATLDLRTENLEWLSGLSSLKYLNMENLEVSDTNWLQSVNMLPNLVELHFPGCSLTSLPLSLPFVVNLTLLSVFDLSSNGLNSSIPNWLSNLTSLTKLDLSSNIFSGSLPSEFSINLKSLEALDLSYNWFEGELPIFWGNLCKLKFLDLSANNFNSEVVEFFGAFSGCPTNCLVSLKLVLNSLQGELPDSIGILKNLQHLDLSDNSFWGSIPKSFGNLSNLQELDISNNNMNGAIPESFGRLSNLIRLNLDNNSWEGVVTEVHLMNLISLEFLSIIKADKNRSLVFNVAYEWLPPFKLRYLELENCLVGPKFPVWLQVQNELTFVSLQNSGIVDTIAEEWFSRISSRLTYLDLSNNRIKGNLPNHLEYPKVDYINLSNNQFEGSLPLWSSNASGLLLNNNSFWGPIPSNIGELMPQLKVLYLFENRLSGTIPTSICKMQKLISLVLRTNQLSGELPQCWNVSSAFLYMDMANNNLSGEIPSSLGSLSSLRKLMLGYNNLHGKIPPSLQNCSLVIIDIGGNNLSGNLSLWMVENVPALQILRLRSNLFSGDISQQWCKLTDLHILDLADNNISGVIPSCFGNLTALAYGSSREFFIGVEQITLMLKGRKYEYGKIMNYVNSIDLSSNSLIGEIPEEITSLVTLVP
ncbi:receptor-like protein EIX2 [Cornus florida]|uniref:receptor-like protein EIX2 n=1 Tax=Cornus florida TaxID=4283 RepID=UPI00289A4632|nr:receptor-like protein EIX2 [Cornus florida]